ncbi:DEAH-box RNA-dependent ATPase PRP2 KNAG_0D00560 [Huiozyma naganishii CBS 8797]|uniref:RNA helicase n=1 Tax=Huiozyma naganishii (strain ATCC MYA-139 / BCRC 22969 / CBS 8797 / KCTC 17520 / NBRC 10181 / NCYC 3082 / Yp74L-3) TaxID=1071383 RepID=J7RJX3_HUIN7|nr:hypothetical protein KNAG_0D00560 [Kazachstania naganishii CBS 8797]CCK69808.1 hypothetical protein KNAG_0D00560 [Kazachstania naganishii CBS 8797]
METGGTGKRRIRRRFDDESVDRSAELPAGADSQRDDGERFTADTSVFKEPVLPKVSRYNNEPAEIQKYKRLRRELAFLQRKVQQVGFDRLSEHEQKEIELKKDLLQLMESKSKVESNTEGFVLAGTTDETSFKNGSPDSMKPRPMKEDNKSRQQMWEERVLSYAVAKNDSDEIYVDGSKQYDYVFDDSAMINFTSDVEDTVPGGEDSSEGDEESDEEDEATTKYAKIQEAKKSLPVYHHRARVMKAIQDNQVLIIVGETGSGKTTQLPQYLVEDGYTQDGKYQVGVTQPRRVAATSVAARVAEEMDVKLGREVGYSIRFDDKTTPGKTVLKYVTDGMLLRECLTDPDLKKYSCIVIDEAHERTLATDILLGLLKNILARREDLKVLISSATMNTAKFSKFFGDCPILTIPGRRYPVNVHYTLQPEGNYINAAITTVFQIHTTQATDGDILLFLTGQEEIESTREKIEQIASKLGTKIPQLIIAPIYANLPQDQQALIFEPTPENCRKLVIATNIAETSLTIDGIKYVIDPGYVKENSYVPSTGMTQLLTVPCSRASIEQRAGRAGRVGPGSCFRLFTKWSFENELEMMPKPEILRTNLSNTVLLLLSLGVMDLLNFPFVDKPSIPALTKSLESLYVLGALSNRGQITELGKMMCVFPCEPEFAKVLHTASADEKCNGVLEECLSIVSMLHETTSLFIGNKRNAAARIVSETEGDHLLYLEVFRQWRDSGFSRTWCQDHRIQFKTMCRVRNIRSQLSRCCQKLGLSAQSKTAAIKLSEVIPRITRSFISGFPTNVVQLTNSGNYKMLGRQTGALTVSIHPSSVVFQNYKENAKKPDKYLLYQQLMLTSKEFIRDLLPVTQESWLTETVPQVYQELLGKRQP